MPILPLACPSPNAGNREFQPGFAYPAFGMPQGLCQSCLWLVPGGLANGAFGLPQPESCQSYLCPAPWVVLFLLLACPKGCAYPAFGMPQGLCQCCLWLVPTLRLEITSSSWGLTNGASGLLHGSCRFQLGSYQWSVWPAPWVLQIPARVLPMERLAWSRGSIDVNPFQSIPSYSEPFQVIFKLCQAQRLEPMGRLAWPRGVVPIVLLACPGPGFK